MQENKKVSVYLLVRLMIQAGVAVIQPTASQTEKLDNVLTGCLHWMGFSPVFETSVSR